MVDNNEDGLLEQEPNKKKGKKKYLLLLLLLLLGSITIIAYAITHHINNTNNGGLLIADSAIEGNLTLNNEDLLAALQREADENRVTIQINGNPIFEYGDSKGSLLLGNPDVNLFDMHVVIKDIATDIILYDSGLIPPGFLITEDYLKTTLEAGDHLATARITYLTPEQDIVSTTNVEITITVEN